MFSPSLRTCCFRSWAGIWVAWCLAIAGPRWSSADEPQVDFARQVLPILSEKCFVCHGPDAPEADMLRLDSPDGATEDRGGYRAIDPEDPARSELLQRIFSEDDPMPPAEAEKRLTETERQVLRDWVMEGGRYSAHWAFRPPRRHPPPRDDNDAEHHPIDAFLRMRFPAGIDFAPEADRRTLARRVALVLTGLPPEPEVLEAFLADRSPAAYERLVDRLLQSPRFGEHQARYWLDAVRYGDTHGLHLDNRRGIYPYRDWVVRAFNENLPLDEFLVWQLAGDLLPSPTLEQQIATGFVRMNPSTAEGGAIAAEFQAKNNFDRTEMLGTVLLGLSLTCARCHTHKYDPIPQSDYYGLLAFFNSTAEPALDGNSYTYGPVVRVPEDQATWSTWNRLERERAQFLAEFDAAGRTGASAGSSDSPEVTSPDERLRAIADPEGSWSGTSWQQRAAALLTRIEQTESQFTTTLVARDLEQPRPTFILHRGEYDQPAGEPVQPGILSILGDPPPDAPRNRLGLARWVTSRDHPLVARVLVNRMWQRTFGAGLVRTPEDFGVRGEQPTHPLLLDWLAVELHESGWDMKHLLRLMVTSRAFRQSSAWREALEDPANRLWARGPSHRLDAEVIRDMGLWASGLLEPHMGGEGVKPYQPPGMWLAMAHPASNTKNYVRDTGPLLYRRSLYVYWKRSSPHPMMTLFDAPDRESSCVRRARTSTSLQSLGLLNETQRIEIARMTGQRLLQQPGSTNDRLDLLFTLVASRTPTENERAACLMLFESARDRFGSSPDDAQALLSIGEAARDTAIDVAELAAWTQVVTVVLASDPALLLY